MKIRLIVGLGNPGEKYKTTRHNIGFEFVDFIAKKQNAVLTLDSRFKGELGQIAYDRNIVHGFKPMSFMNNSGEPVATLINFFKISPPNILVVHDDLDIPTGETRMKFSGGSGGHNGLKSIISCLGTNTFWRLRIGIGHPREQRLLFMDPEPVANYVLKPPTAIEAPEIDAAILNSQTALVAILGNNHGNLAYA